MYNFNINKMLNDFNGDSEELASAFLEALNKEVENRQTMEYVNSASIDTADAWNDMVENYFNVHTLPKGFKEEDFMIEHDTPRIILELMIEQAKKECANQVKPAGETKTKPTVKPVASIKINRTPSDEQVIEDFLTRMGW